MPFAVAPTIGFRLRIENADRLQQVHSIALRCQIQIETTRRRYKSDEQDRLFDLFGEPERWGQTLRSMLWTNVSANVPGFTGTSFFNLPVPCSFDFNVAATKYFAALSDGEIPLCLLFSGTIFYESEDSALQVEQIPWEKEATYRLPVTTWQKMMELYYPNEKWLSLRQDVFDLLYEYKRRHGIPTWEQAVEKLLATAAERKEKEMAMHVAS